MQVNGQLRRVFIHGDHIVYQGVERFHGSDSDFRLTMAVTAAEALERRRIGESGYKCAAAVLVAQAILRSPSKRLRLRFLRKPAQTNDSDLVRLSDTVRRVVNRYRAAHPQWREEFQIQVNLYRSGYFKDEAWFQEVQEQGEKWILELQQREGFEWFEASKVVSIARMYHQRRKFDDAMRVYQLALQIAGKALMSDELREYVRAWLENAVDACKRREPPPSEPVYAGRRAPESAES
jgi:tetratricopeptide (TPR) repeat protein